MSSHFGGLFSGGQIQWCDARGGRVLVEKIVIFLGWETRKLKPEKLWLLKRVKESWKGKSKQQKKRISNSDYPVSLNRSRNHACTEQTQRDSFREKYLDKHRKCHLKTEFLVLIRKKKKIRIFPKLNICNDQDTTQSYLTYKEPRTWNILLKRKGNQLKMTLGWPRYWNYTQGF